MSAIRGECRRARERAYTVRDDRGDTTELRATSPGAAAREDARRTAAFLGADCPDLVTSTVLVGGRWVEFRYRRSRLAD